MQKRKEEKRFPDENKQEETFKSNVKSFLENIAIYRKTNNKFHSSLFCV